MAVAGETWRFGRRGVCALLVAALACLVCPARLAAAPDGGGAAMPFLQTAEALRDAAKEHAGAGCTQADGLVRILCAGRIVVGVKTDYAGFSSVQPGEAFAGFEVDIAREVAAFLGVALVLKPVSATDRIPKLASGQVDLLLATMGHNQQRDGQVRFIRPHYYQSETVVVGALGDRVTDWGGLAGRTVCIPIGSSSNAMFARNGVSILIFDQPEELLDALKFNTCQLIVHDDTFFTAALSDPKWAAQFGIKFGFAPLPWGMAVQRDGSDRLAALLDALSAAYHAQGTFQTLAARNHIRTGFLEAQQAGFATGDCAGPQDGVAAACLLPPAATVTEHDRTSFADLVTAWEQAAQTRFGITLPLAPLKDRSGVQLLRDGLVLSLLLIVGGIAATLLCAFAVGALLCGYAGRAGRVVGSLSFIAQTTPMPLMLFFGYIVASGLFPYSGTAAMLVAVTTIGLLNGSYAGRALADVHAAVLRATGAAPGLWTAARIARTQLCAFLINAAKGSPAAGMIGAPEFLNTLTDLTAYTSDRIFIYVVLLVFYSALVLLVIWLTDIAQRTVLAPA